MMEVYTAIATRPCIPVYCKSGSPSVNIAEQTSKFNASIACLSGYEAVNEDRFRTIIII